VALVLGILLAGLLGLLLLNTASAQDAFRLHRLQASAAGAADERQALSDQVNRLTGPAGLATRAQQLGMVPQGPPQFWKPGEPLPPGARVIDGMVVVPAPGAPKPAATEPPAPSDPQDAAVTTVQRPIGGTKPAAAPSAKASSKPSSQATSKASTKPSTKATTKPSTSTKASTKPSTTSGKAGSTATGQTRSGG
jgi:hypothetical protein